MTDKELEDRIATLADKCWRGRSEAETAEFRSLRVEQKRRQMASQLGDGVGVMAYSSNNSGGSWWLSDADWNALHEAGWTVFWNGGDTPGIYADDIAAAVLSREDCPQDCERWLGSIARHAAKAGTSPRDLIEEFESITGQNAGAEGCNCCGSPHNFTWHAPDGTQQSPDLVVTSRLSYPEGW